MYLKYQFSWIPIETVAQTNIDFFAKTTQTAAFARKNQKNCATFSGHALEYLLSGTPGLNTTAYLEIIPENYQLNIYVETCRIRSGKRHSLALQRGTKTL